MKKLATRTTQRIQTAEFAFNWNDWVVDSATGVKETFGSTVALAVDPLESGLTGPAANTITFDAIPMPLGAVIMGGAVIVETAVAGSTAYTVSLGIAGSLTTLANAVDGKTAGRTALTLTSPLLSNAGQNLRATIAYTVANATAGRIRLRVDYTIDGKADEICIA
jgi:hypothetical protein